MHNEPCPVCGMRKDDPEGKPVACRRCGKMVFEIPPPNVMPKPEGKRNPLLMLGLAIALLAAAISYFVMARVMEPVPAATQTVK